MKKSIGLFLSVFMLIFFTSNSVQADSVWKARSVAQIKTGISSEQIMYDIQWGDTLSNISLAFNKSIEDILKRNTYIDNPDLIYVGNKLLINDYVQNENAHNQNNKSRNSDNKVNDASSVKSNSSSNDKSDEKVYKAIPFVK